MKRRGLHYTTAINAKRNRVTKREIYGAEHIVVEGAGSIIADTVMNGIHYPKEEVERLASDTVDAINAPSAHPVDDKGNFISAGHPAAIQKNYVGAMSMNYRMDGDRLVRDIAINTEIANRSEDGKEILRRIEAGEDTDTSTGLLMYIEEMEGVGNDGETYKYVARDMELDHDAILLRERGAATSAMGVGVFANSASDKFQVDEQIVNTSSPAMNLPLASEGTVWDSAAADQRIRDYTNSGDTPSSNYRRYFFAFDRDKVEEYGAYKLPFADIIDGRPHAVKSAIDNAKARLDQTDISDSDKKAALSSIETYQGRFDKDTASNKSIWQKFKDVIWGNQDQSFSDISEMIWQKLNEGRDDDDYLWPQELFPSFFVYSDQNGKLYKQAYRVESDAVEFEGMPEEVERMVEYKPVTNGDRKMRDKILAALNAANVDVEGKDDEALLAAYNELKAQKVGEDNSEPKGLTIEQVTEAINAAVTPLQEQLQANADKEKADLVSQVVGLDIGIDEGAAKAMEANALKAIVAKNGTSAFTPYGGSHQQSTSDLGALPSVEV